VFGVTAICRVLGVPVASVRSSLSRPVPARVLADEQLKKLIFELFEDNYSVYGRKKLRKALRREHGLTVDKDRVGRLMGELGIRGVHRGHQPWTTKPDVSHPRAPDLVKRRFVADRPNQLMGVGLHVRFDVVRVCLCGVHRRCVLANDCWLAGLNHDDYQPCHGCVGACHLDAESNIDRRCDRTFRCRVSIYKCYVH
jgi:hypothetical protein